MSHPPDLNVTPSIPERQKRFPGPDTKLVKSPAMPPLMAILFGILAVSLASVFIRYAQAYAPSLVIAAYRLSLATLLLTPLAITRHREEIGALKRFELFLALLSGTFLALHFATWISSLEYTTVASSVVLVSTTPLWVALLSPFTIHEPITRAITIGLVLALAGGTIVGLSDSCSLSAAGLTCPTVGEFLRGDAFFGDLLALVGALMGACYLLIGRRLRVKMSLISYITLVYGMAAVVLVIIMLAAGDSPLGYPPQAYLWFILLALVPQLIGHTTFNWALRYLSVAFVSIALLGEPIGSTILAYFLLDEVPSGLKIIGAILILAGIYIASKSEA